MTFEEWFNANRPDRKDSDEYMRMEWAWDAGYAQALKVTYSAENYALKCEEVMNLQIKLRSAEQASRRRGP